jgi:threonine synthase
MSIWRWRELFLDLPAASCVTLGEGDTPIVRSRSIGPAAGLKNLCFKFEGVNPTGSYKDRFAAAAVSQMLHEGKRRCVATSSGNTGAALAAYCAAAGIACDIAVVEPAPAEKLKQMLAYGARVYKVRGFGIDPDITRRTFEAVTRRAAAPDAALQISAYAFSPAGMSGVQTIAYELHEQTADRLDHVFVPAGGGGLTLAAARGFETLVQRGLRTRGPRIECVQPVGNDTIAGPLRAGSDRARPVTGTTRISGLQVSSVLDGHDVIAACRRSGGTGHLVSDEDVWAVQARLAREEGIFCEPAAAVSVAAALQARAAGELAGDAVVCCVLTGVGFKDQPSVDRMAGGDCPTVGWSTLNPD